MKYTLKSGAVIEGSIEQILSIAKSLGETVTLSTLAGTSRPKGYYLSSTQGVVKIETMNEGHIKNALLKCAREWYETKNFNKLSNEAFLQKFVAFTEDSLLEELFEALSAKIKR
jgi:hypothetical protein